MRLWLILVVLVVAGSAVAAVILRSSAPDKTLIVWIAPGTSGSRVHFIEERSRAVLGTSDCLLWSQAKDFREAERILPPSERQTLTAANTPSSFRCQVPSGPRTTVGIRELKSLRGVITVTFPSTPHVTGA
jgi:hypothetical protein